MSLEAADESHLFQTRFRLRTEGARERDVFWHLHPWTDQHTDAGFRHHSFSAYANKASLPKPHPCPDTALTAFAQLCALRLHTKRCFVTLLSSSVEYVLVEATRTMSLQYDNTEDPKDRAWLGTSSFLRDEGLTVLALDTWRRARHIRETPADSDFYYTQSISPHWHIISDVRGDEKYAHRGFVQRNARVRFYASVPLRGALGSVLGSLTVVDEAPRFGLSVADVTFMEDVADTITQHLDATVVRSQRQRSERLVQSLGLFNSGKSSLRHWWMRQEDARISNAGRHKVLKIPHAQQRAAASKEFGFQEASSSDQEKPALSPDEAVSETSRHDNVYPSQTTFQNVDARHGGNQAHVASQDFDHTRSNPVSKTRRLQADDPARSGTRTPSPQHRQPKSTARNLKSETVNESFDLATASRKMYARASNLMREALAADAVVFVNASNAPIETHESSTALNSSLSSGTAGEHLGHSDTDASEGSPEAQSCNVDAFSTTEKSSLYSTDSVLNFRISEDLLSSLVRKYPQGRIFNFTQDGGYCSSSYEDSTASGSNSERQANRVRKSATSDGKRLRDIMIGANTIAFYPVWDDTRDRWCSGVFVWSTSPLRFFDPVEDMTYLASWGHSILAELGRLQTITADKAKGSFISSVSHELRSPLHGILAGVEFLKESELTSFQQDMAHTIDIAGRTLLDTVDHILDYSKMSSFTRSRKRQRALRTNVGNANDVSDSNEAGGTPTVDLARLTEEVIETLVSAHRYQSLRNTGADDLSIAIKIPWRKEWMVELHPGSWTRILNNLVGNSLKYCTKGLISVEIDVGDPDDENEDIHHVRLIVQDTGIGISKQFLSSDLYTPFRQEDSHSVGTGLGLSIVRHICKDIGADLRISSELGKGTRATVDFKARFIRNAEDRMYSRQRQAIPSTRDLNVDLFHWISPGSIEPSPSSVGHSVLMIAKDWLDCEIGTGPVAATAGRSAVHAIADDDLLQWANDGAESLRAKLLDIAKTTTHVLVLGRSLRNVAPSVPLKDLPFVPVFLHQPIGPQKLFRTIMTDQRLTRQGSTNDKSSDSVDPSSIFAYDTREMDSPTSPLKNHNLEWTHPEGTGQLRNGVVGLDPNTTETFMSNSNLSSLEWTLQRHAANNSVRTSAPSQSGSSSRASTISTVGVSDRERQRDSVLLVEDNEVNMKLLAALMRKLSMPHSIATNGREAIEAYRANPSSFFLILMDMSMPVMDGFTATSKIREIERKLRQDRCAIVALTGVTSDEAKGRAFTCGVDEFFSKPVHMKEVKELIERAKRNEVGVQQQRVAQHHDT